MEEKAEEIKVLYPSPRPIEKVIEALLKIVSPETKELLSREFASILLKLSFTPRETVFDRWRDLSTVLMKYQDKIKEEDINLIEDLIIGRTDYKAICDASFHQEMPELSGAPIVPSS